MKKKHFQIREREGNDKNPFPNLGKEGNLKNPFLKFGKGKGMKKSLPKVREWESQASILENDWEREFLLTPV